MRGNIAVTLLVCVISVARAFIPTINVVKYSSATNIVRNPLRSSTELLAKKKGSKLISDDFLSSLDQFDETPAVAAPPAVVKNVVEVEKETVFIVEPEATETKSEGEEAGDVKKKKKKRDKSKKDYFSNVDLNDSKEEEAGNGNRLPTLLFILLIFVIACVSL